MRDYFSFMYMIFLWLAMIVGTLILGAFTVLSFERGMDLQGVFGAIGTFLWFTTSIYLICRWLES